LRSVPGTANQSEKTIGQPETGAARAAFAFAHGMVTLELNDGFPPTADLDAAWQRGVDTLPAAASRPRTGHGRPQPLKGRR
jgi:hypothetical protein